MAVTREYCKGVIIMNCDFNQCTEVTLVLRSINNLLMRATVHQAKKSDIDNFTIMHGWILGYLYDNKTTDVYQRDIEKQFSITRSTVTSIVKNMEALGYIKRIDVEHDARLKKLVITEDGELMFHKIIGLMQQMDKEIKCGINNEDYTAFLRVCSQVKDNLSKLN